jgi:hypothetical protein
LAADGTPLTPGSSWLAEVEVPLRALTEAFVPEASQLDEAGWSQFTSTVTDALRGQPESVRKQVALLIRLLDWLPVARHGRRLHSLPVSDRTRFLLSLQDSRLTLLRRGIWGLRTLAFMGIYTRPEAYAAIGYAARAEGWEAPG